MTEPVSEAGPVADNDVGRPDRFQRAQALADAVLYEGYVLYPYRRSSGKNQVRWQFGVLAPQSWIEARGPVTDSVAGSTESWWQQTECLLEAPTSAVVHLRIRFLQVQPRAVEVPDAELGFRAVERLDVGDRTELSFDEAVPRQADLTARIGELLDREVVHPVTAPGERHVTQLRADDRTLGRLVRTTVPLTARARIGAFRVEAPFPLIKLRIRIENVMNADPALPREHALRSALISTHCLAAIDQGSLLSLLDPPTWAEPAVKSCVNVRAFPVLAGPAGDDQLLLSAPIILYDHAGVAPESPGDLHDATEIDEILSLRTLTLTDTEKREARGTDPRVADILDRVDGMPAAVMERLHGTFRSPEGPELVEGSIPGTSTGSGANWWEPGADDHLDPGTDTVIIDGVRIGKGSRVTIDPRRGGTDAHDMFLAGRTAHVEAVLLDVDGDWQLAVTIDDDPSVELHQWFGRYHYYRPEELHPIIGSNSGGPRS